MNLEHIKKYHEENPEGLEQFVRLSQLSISPQNLENLCKGNVELEQMFQEMLIKCLRYTEDVFVLEQTNAEPAGSRDENWRTQREKADLDRHNLHEATMDSINILSRNLAKNGKSNEWLRPVAVNGRSGYSRFAIGFAFSYYLSLRESEE